MGFSAKPANKNWKRPLADANLHSHRSNTDLERPFLLQDRPDDDAVKLHRLKDAAQPPADG